MVAQMTYAELADILQEKLEPLGWTRYDGQHMPAGIQFYAPGTDSGFIEVAGMCHGRQVVDLHISIGTWPAWAPGLRALADVLETL